MNSSVEYQDKVISSLETGDQSYIFLPYPVTEEDLLVAKDFINKQSNEGKNIVISKDLANFCLRHIIKSVTYSKGFGVYNEVLGFHIPEEAYFEIQKMIDNDEFPDGYYKLCDILGEKY